MKGFLKKLKKLEHKHLHELALLCGSMAVLMLVTVFVGSLAPSTAHAWIIYINPFSYTQVTPGGYTTLYWSAPTSDYCTLYGPTLPCTSFGRGHGGGGGSPICYQSFYGANGSVSTGPIYGPTSYTLACINVSGGFGSSDAQGYSSVTVVPMPPPPPPTPSTLTSFTATPASVTSGTGTTLSWTGSKGTNFSACELAGGQWGGGAWFTALPGSIATNPLTAATTYSIDCFDTTGTATGWRSVTVNVTAVSDICTDISGAQTVLPPGCTGPTPPPSGLCVPSGSVYNGSACVPQPTSCANGLGSVYLPSCTCPGGQVQSGAVCVTPPPTSCANGLASSYAPSCTCPGGQVQSGSSCVASGSIDTLSASPTRVRKGGTTTITWGTSNMATCALTGPNPNATGMTTLSTALSSTLTPTIGSQSTYTLTCVDKIGTARSQTLTVNLIPETIEQ